MALSSRARHKLRASVALSLGDGSFSGTEIKVAHSVEHEDAGWAMDDSLCRHIILRKYPRLASDSKHRDRAASLWQIVFLSFRLGWTSEQIALNMGLKAKAVRNAIQRTAELARHLLVESGQQPSAVRKTRRGRVLVESGRVVTLQIRDLEFLKNLSDAKIAAQAILSLRELRATDAKLQEKYDAFSLLAVA